MQGDRKKKASKTKRKDGDDKNGADKEPRYSLEVSAKQAHILLEALDLYSRIGSGQLTEVLDYFPSPRFSGEPRPDDFYKRRDEAYNFLHHLKTLLCPELGPGCTSWGIAHPKVHDCFRAAFDLKQVIRYTLAWERKPEGGYTVDFDEPMRLSSATELATFKRVDPSGKGAK